MNIFFRALLVLVFIGVAIFAFARQFGSEKWKESEEDGGKSWPPSKASVWTGLKWIGIPGLIVALFFLFGQYTLEHDAYEREQTREARAELKEEAISSLYAAPSGKKLDYITVRYVKERDEEEDKVLYSGDLIEYEVDFERITPVLGTKDSYFFRKTPAGNEPVYRTGKPDNPFRVYVGDTVRVEVEEPRRTKHCVREPLVKWGIASGAGNAAERRVFRLGSPISFEIEQQGYPVLDVFCPIQSGDVVSVSVKTIKLQKQK